jgi:hypothetical protein
MNTSDLKGLIFSIEVELIQNCTIKKQNEY